MSAAAATKQMRLQQHSEAVSTVNSVVCLFQTRGPARQIAVNTFFWILSSAEYFSCRPL